jgi:hypothetical protein
MNPYFYKIKHKTSGKIYVGCQYHSLANKNDFWKTYFTSSKTIHKLINSEGANAFDIILILERVDAQQYEHRYLSKAFHLLGKKKFTEIFYNRTLSPGIVLTPEIIDKTNKTKRERWSSGIIKKPVPPSLKGSKRSDRMKQRLSASKLGHAVSSETRKKLSEANIGKKQSAETIEKRKAAFLLNEKSCGKKYWLFISPTSMYYYMLGSRNTILASLKLSSGPGFRNYVNTGSSPKNGKNVGWLFYEGKDIINKILENISKDKVIKYER